MRTFLNERCKIFRKNFSHFLPDCLTSLSPMQLDRVSEEVKLNILYLCFSCTLLLSQRQLNLPIIGLWSDLVTTVCPLTFEYFVSTNDRGSSIFIEAKNEKFLHAISNSQSHFVFCAIHCVPLSSNDPLTQLCCITDNQIISLT